MLVALRLPPIGRGQHAAPPLVHARKIHAAEGSSLPVGAKLLDVRVDFGTAAPQDCPPAASFLLAAREPLWLRRWLVARDSPLSDGMTLALLTTGPNGPPDGEPARAARISFVAVLEEPDWWPRG